MIVATWNSSFKSLYKGIDAQAVAEEITSIGESATPQEIVEKAKEESSELHKCFEWDNDTAAERWRIYQARQIVCHLVIQRTEEQKAEQKPEIRIFHKTDAQSGYKKADIVFTVNDEYQECLKRALAELNAFRAKYAHLKELDYLFELIDKEFKVA